MMEPKSRVAFTAYQAYNANAIQRANILRALKNCPVASFSLTWNSRGLGVKLMEN